MGHTGAALFTVSGYQLHPCAPPTPAAQVNLVISDVRNRLFVGGLPRDMSQEQLTQAFKAEVKGGWE